MIDAVVYTSSTGFTAKYAAMLAKNLSVEALSLETAKKRLASGAAVVYLGWLKAGTIQKLKVARRAFSVKAVCGVGMAPPSANERERLARQNGLSLDGFFLLQGGFDMQKLSGANKFMMTFMSKALRPNLEKKIAAGTASDMEKEMLEMVTSGKDCTSEKALSDVESYINQISI